MRLTDVSAVSEGGHIRHWQGNNVTTLLWFSFRRCFTRISSDTLRFTGIKSYLMETARVHERKTKHPAGEVGIKQISDWLSGPGSLASPDSDAWLPDLLTCDDMAPKLELPNAAAIIWLIFFSLVRPAEANDAGNTLAVVVLAVVCVVGFCACLGWYARRRNGQLWSGLRSPMLASNTSLTVRNQPGTTYEPLWLIKTCL